MIPTSQRHFEGLCRTPLATQQLYTLWHNHAVIQKLPLCLTQHTTSSKLEKLQTDHDPQYLQYETVTVYRMQFRIAKTATVIHETDHQISQNDTS